jgi:hypothetical protein
MLRSMSLLADTARFRTNDPDELVIASLACPFCLHGDDVEWELDADGYDPSAQCLCRRCEEPWRVYMTPYQALRLGLMAVRASAS